VDEECEYNDEGDETPVSFTPSFSVHADVGFGTLARDSGIFMEAGGAYFLPHNRGQIWFIPNERGGEPVLIYTDPKDAFTGIYGFHFLAGDYYYYQREITRDAIEIFGNFGNFIIPSVHLPTGEVFWDDQNNKEMWFWNMSYDGEHIYLVNNHVRIWQDGDIIVDTVDLIKIDPATRETLQTWTLPWRNFAESELMVLNDKVYTKESSFNPFDTYDTRGNEFQNNWEDGITYLITDLTTGERSRLADAPGGGTIHMQLCGNNEFLFYLVAYSGDDPVYDIYKVQDGQHTRFFNVRDAGIDDRVSALWLDGEWLYVMTYFHTLLRVKTDGSMVQEIDPGDLRDLEFHFFRDEIVVSGEWLAGWDVALRIQDDAITEYVKITAFEGARRIALDAPISLITLYPRPERTGEPVSNSIPQSPVSVRLYAGYGRTLGINPDGTVAAIGLDDFGSLDIGDWNDIAAVADGKFHTVGLKSDGTVVAAGPNWNGELDVDGWSDIIAVSAGEGITAGVKSDGTVLVAGWDDFGQHDAGGWSGITDISVSGSGYHIVGLRTDGTVVVAGPNWDGEGNVGGWDNIIAVSAGGSHTVGLRDDGTVAATGRNNYDQLNVRGWTDIIAISGGDIHTVGLRADGTVVSAGGDSRSLADANNWTDIIAVSAGDDFTIGLKSDGTVVAVGSNWAGQLDVSGWRLE